MPPSMRRARAPSAPAIFASVNPTTLPVCASAASGFRGAARAARTLPVADGLPPTSTITVPSGVPGAMGADGKLASGLTSSFQAGAGWCLDTTTNRLFALLTATGAAAVGTFTVPTKSSLLTIGSG